MKRWKLIAHHTHPEEAWTVIKATNTLAVGWECVGDMNHTPYASAAAIRDRIKEEYSDLTGQNHSNGGSSLWDFFHTMKKGDLVVVSASGSRRGVFVVTGDYQYKAEGTSYDNGYPHQRSVRPIRLEELADALWNLTEISAGASPYRTLVGLSMSHNA